MKSHKLLYVEKPKRYFIIKDTEVGQLVARVSGSIFFEDPAIILHSFQHEEIFWEVDYPYFSMELSEVVGSFNSKDDINNVFPEYLI